MSREYLPAKADTAFSALMRKRRRELGMSQQSVALAVGISWQQIQKFENGINRVSVGMFVKICGALGLRADEVMREIAE